jgi:hypothetical protein
MNHVALPLVKHDARRAGPYKARNLAVEIWRLNEGQAPTAEISARFLGSNPVITLPIAVFIRAASFVLGYSFSAAWRSLTLAKINRARVFLSNLTNRVKRSPSVNTSVQK